MAMAGLLTLSVSFFVTAADPTGFEIWEELDASLRLGLADIWRGRSKLIYKIYGDQSEHATAATETS